MTDPFVARLLENEKLLKGLSDDKVIMLTLSELVYESSLLPGATPGDKAKRITLASSLAQRAGIKF